MAPDVDQMRRSSMAAERTWLAWWRTALAATAGALAVGRFAPTLLDVAAWPYVVLGCCYAGLAVGLLVVGARRQRDLEASLHGDTHHPIHFGCGGVHRRRHTARGRDDRAGRGADLARAGRGGGRRQP
jgi:Domain of unknown function (DUF202)